MKKEAFSIGPADASANDEQGDRTGNTSRPKPEEGLRLMRAFMEIGQADVREAIIKYVEEQSKP